MLVVKPIFPVPSHDMRNHLGDIPKSDRRELVIGANGQR